MEKPKDFYTILGVPRNATQAAIKRAYRRLTKKLPPDLGAVHEAALAHSPDAFQALQAAYEVLADSERRRRYDESLQQLERDRFAPLSWSFVRSPASGDLRRPTMPGSLSGEILLTPQEAAAGGVLPLDVPLLATCPACDGTGGFVFDCGRCGGEGKVERRMPVPIRIPAGIPDGTVFQLAVDDPAVLSVLLTVHIRSL